MRDPLNRLITILLTFVLALASLSCAASSVGEAVTQSEKSDHETLLDYCGSSPAEQEKMKQQVAEVSQRNQKAHFQAISYGCRELARFTLSRKDIEYQEELFSLFMEHYEKPGYLQFAHHSLRQIRTESNRVGGKLELESARKRIVTRHHALLSMLSKAEPMIHYDDDLFLYRIISTLVQDDLLRNFQPNRFVGWPPAAQLRAMRDAFGDGSQPIEADETRWYYITNFNRARQEAREGEANLDDLLRKVVAQEPQ